MAKDNAGVLAFPPAIFATCVAVGVLLHAIRPLPMTAGPLIRWLGGGVVLLAGGLAIWAQRTMKAAGTNVRPDRPTRAIVTGGPYRLTRNPMYVSLGLLQLAMALLLNDWTVLVMVPVLIAILHVAVVWREEAYLERKFGAEYREFCRRVRRWF